MAERIRSKDGSRDSDMFLKDVPETPTFSGREGGDLAREVGTRDQLKQRMGGSGVTRPTKAQSRPKPEHGDDEAIARDESAPQGPAEGSHSSSEDMSSGLWVIVANGEKALFLQNHGDREHPDLRVLRKEEIDNPPTREQAANRRGRMSDSQGNKSAFQDTDWHQLGKERFAADLADWLYAAAHKGAFDRLVLVADPSTLGELRPALHQEVTGKLIAEMDKDLTNQPIHEIEAHVFAALDRAD